MIANATLTDDLRRVAKDFEKIDRDVYAQWSKDPLEPIIGEGDPMARLCIFGLSLIHI